MRLLVIIILHIISFGAIGQAPDSGKISINLVPLYKANAKANVGMPFPNFKANNETEAINNDMLKGKVVLVNFWFEACHPCMAEMNALNELYLKLKDNKDFEFISFTWDTDAAIKRVKEKFNLQFKVFHADQEECLRLNQNNGYPTTILIDRNGKIAYLKSGGPVDPEKARAYILGDFQAEITQALLLK